MILRMAFGGNIINQVKLNWKPVLIRALEILFIILIMRTEDLKPRDRIKMIKWMVTGFIMIPKVKKFKK